jgi:putative DNA primase/helicase
VIVEIDGASFEIDAEEHCDLESVAAALSKRGLTVADDASDEERVEALVRGVTGTTPVWRQGACGCCRAPIDVRDGCDVCATASDAPTLTDAGNARRFVIEHGEQVRYCLGLGGWLVYDGKRWTADTTAAERLAKDTARSIYGEAEDAEDPKATALHAVRSESARAIVAMLRLAQSEPGIAVQPDAFDRDPMILNTPSGVVDLRTGETRPHAADDLAMHMTGAPFEANASSPLLDFVLSEATGGDEEIIAFLGRVFGYAATGRTDEEKLFLIHGPAASAKSTLIEAVKASLGSYAMTADFTAFISRESSGPRNDIARLAGARLVSSIEVEKGRKLAEGLVKSVTGGDLVTARFLHKEAFTFKPGFKLFLVANDAPRADDEDTGLWRRIARVPFEHVVPKEKRDPRVKATLCNPRVSGPAILAWMVRGCLEWQRIGLSIPAVIEAATEAYRESQDPLAEFFADECTFSPGAWASRDAILKRYERWREHSGTRFPLTPKTMADRLRKRDGLSEGKRSGVRGWIGIGLIDHAVDDDGIIKGGSADWSSANASPREKQEHRRRRAAYLKTNGHDTNGNGASSTGALGAREGHVQGTTIPLFLPDGTAGTPVPPNSTSSTHVRRKQETGAPSAPRPRGMRRRSEANKVPS